VYASLGRIERPVSAAHSFGSNTCAHRPHQHECLIPICASSSLPRHVSSSRRALMGVAVPLHPP
jgi:hypothetical protein